MLGLIISQKLAEHGVALRRVEIDENYQRNFLSITDPEISSREDQSSNIFSKEKETDLPSVN